MARMWWESGHLPWLVFSWVLPRLSACFCPPSRKLCGPVTQRHKIWSMCTQIHTCRHEHFRLYKSYCMCLSIPGFSSWHKPTCSESQFLIFSFCNSYWVHASLFWNFHHKPFMSAVANPPVQCYFNFKVLQTIHVFVIHIVPVLTFSPAVICFFP